MSSRRMGIRGIPTARQIQINRNDETTEDCHPHVPANPDPYGLAAVLAVTQEPKEEPAEYVPRCSGR